MSKITVDIETGTTERKLRAISKHTEALADELNHIDEFTCSECGSDHVCKTTAKSDHNNYTITYECNDCGNGWYGEEGLYND